MTDTPSTLRPAVFHILLALSAGTKHGLGIAERAAETTEGAITLGPGTLYRSLKEMLRDGLIEEVPPPSSDEDPRRRFYRLTDHGFAQLRNETERMARIVEVAREQRVLPESP